MYTTTTNNNNNQHMTEQKCLELQQSQDEEFSYYFWSTDIDFLIV